MGDSESIVVPIDMRKRERIMFLSAFSDVSFFTLNLIGALLANSLTLWINTLHVGLDVVASFFAHSVIKRIMQGKSHEFDYGLGKWENLSALFNAVVMLVGIVFIIFHAVLRIIHPEPVIGAGFGIFVLSLFTGLNFWLLFHYRRMWREDNSTVMHGQYILLRNNCSATVISLIAVLVSWLGGKHSWAHWFDPMGALALSGVIFYGMSTLFKKSLPTLLDKTLDEAMQFHIMKGLAKCFNDYEQIHKIRTRHSGNKIFVELFLEYEPNLLVREMMTRSGRLKTLVEDLIPRAEVWVIPCSESDFRNKSL